MKAVERWHSDRIGQGIQLVRWGHYGAPVLLFPTAGGDAEEVERFHLVSSLQPLIDAGRIKVYSIDSVAGRAWVSGAHSPEHCGWLQNQFQESVYHEVVPAIRGDCGGSPVEIITAGASIGAFNAVAIACRRPDVFRMAIGMSGTYDLDSYLKGKFSQDFYFSSPMHYLPNLNGGSQLDALRHRFILMAYGQGRWEDPDQSWRMSQVLGSKGVPNRVDVWGHEYDHDWPTWRQMLPLYLAELT